MRTFLRIALAIAVMAVAGCATLENGTTQRIPVTSDPPGAGVLLDGRPAGVTPTSITVSRRDREPKIEVVMDGFTPARQRLERREDWMTIFWSAFLGSGLIPIVGRLTVPNEDAQAGFWHTIGVFALGVLPGAIDFGSGGAFRFRPDRVDADLSPLRQGRGSSRCARCSRAETFCLEIWSCSATSARDRSSRSRSRTTSRNVGGRWSIASARLTAVGSGAEGDANPRRERPLLASGVRLSRPTDHRNSHLHWPRRRSHDRDRHQCR